ncbi:MAG: hypothetical protein IPM98_18040 [Lewinellaceae bacterium]|nr:hypothetical protein [Lewinellaceae bacterium]
MTVTVPAAVIAGGYAAHVHRRHLVRAGNVLLFGQEAAGFSLSSTVMVCVQRSVFPQASSAWYVLEIVVGQVPLGTSLMCVTVTVPPQLSLVGYAAHIHRRHLVGRKRLCYLGRKSPV